MSKSYAEMADEILNGALTNPAKNPYDPATGHQATMPAMDPQDKLVEMSDSQRRALLSHSGVRVEEIHENKKEEVNPEPPSGWGEPTTTMELTAQDLQTLAEAKKIIEKIQEATTVGNIGVNMAGGTPAPRPTKQTVPGDVNVSAKPKKRVKKATPKQKGYDFLSYLKA